MEENKPKHELPPFVKSWKQFYWMLAGWLGILIALFYIFTAYFA